MKLTEEQKNILVWALDMDNNGPDWLYSETKDGDTKVYIRRAMPDGNSADSDYWGEEEDITEEYIEQCKRLCFWGE